MSHTTHSTRHATFRDTRTLSITRRENFLHRDENNFYINTQTFYDDTNTRATTVE